MKTLKITDKYNQSKIHMVRMSAEGELQYNQALEFDDGTIGAPLYDWVALESTGYADQLLANPEVKALSLTLMQQIKAAKSVAHKEAKQEAVWLVQNHGTGKGKGMVIGRGWAVCCFTGENDEKHWLADFSGAVTLKEIKRVIANGLPEGTTKVWVEGGYTPVRSLEDWENGDYDESIYWDVDIDLQKM